ncbi:hypothetical protein L249_6275 [Ophiocordyceps polyrhachis-furcata BCC 54312]|uniref:YCII-related domain-containing protein n=1 Tax=Ophiocordyceps polyrhachis-furcata BCC 54312 TaxID=1330021 RepID=A0A367L0Y3_9HYPO|nr:hypothetical protein L249_6275 [Ophiocordyceps polyrhachis-furcata BCC 54312]
MPRFILLIKSDAKCAEACDKNHPPTDYLENLARLNEQMAEAGVLLAAEGFKPTSDGYVIKYNSSQQHEVVTGPFDVSKEDHTAGFWLLQTKSAEEALGWAKKIPFQSGEVIMRTVGFGHEEFSTHTKELKDREDKLRAQMEKNRRAAGC